MKTSTGLILLCLNGLVLPASAQFAGGVGDGYDSGESPYPASAPFVGGIGDGYDSGESPFTAFDLAQPLALEGSFTLTIDGSGNLVATNSEGTVYSFPLDGLSEINITGTDASETVVVSWDLLDALAVLSPPVVLALDMGEGFDVLEIGAGAAGPADIHHELFTPHSGQISRGGDLVITYDGLDPINDNGFADNREFTFSLASETITLSAGGDGAIGNGYSFIDSDFAEQVSFLNPTETLTINTGDGTNTVVLGALDTPVAGTFTNIEVNGGAGDDTFDVTPVDDYAIVIDGKAQTGCPGDALSIDLSGGAIIDTYDGPPSGIVTFTTGEVAIEYTNIESFGYADLDIALPRSPVYVTEDLTGTSAVVVTVTNHGPDTAACVSVTLDPALSAYLSGGSGLPSVGLFNGTIWDDFSLDPGESATLTLTGMVSVAAPLDANFIVSAPEDTNAGNNTASLAISMGFRFPPKTHVNAATYFPRTVTGADPYDQLIVGIFQGAPGLPGAVWCKIPAEITTGGTVTVWPPLPLTPDAVGDLWRPCSGINIPDNPATAGIDESSSTLPFPLHPTDLFYDADMDRLWLTTWGSAGIYYSNDGGITWVQSNPDPSCVIVYTMTRDMDGFLYISANDGYVFRSFNGGDTWQQVGSLPHVDADTPWSMVARTDVEGTIYAGTFGRGVYVSTDYGFTWSFLGGDDENAVLLSNQGLTTPDVDNPNNINAGHIFDMELIEDMGTDYLFAGTGNGVWRTDADAVNWEFMGPVVDIGATVPCTLTSTDAACQIPEVRTLAVSPTETLIAGTWGFGAYEFSTPTVNSDVVPLTLKAGNVTFVVVSSSGEVFAGTQDGELHTLALGSATATANEPEASTELPTGYALSQNYPNPFNPVTTIQFALPTTGEVRLSVHDALGREVATLIDGAVQAGHHEVQFQASALPSGAYLYRLSTEAGTLSRTLILMK